MFPNVDSFFVIFKPVKGELHWPVFRSADGRDGVAIFTDRTRAQEFLRAKGFDDKAGWGVYQMAPVEMLKWLRINIQNGSSYLLVDPAPDASQGEALEILQVLIEAEN